MKLVFNPLTSNFDFVSVEDLTSYVSAASVLADNTLIRGDGGARGVQDSGITIDDSDDITGVNGVQFDINPSASTPAEGLLQWNATDGTLNLGMSGGDVTMQIGQEQFIKARNAPGYSTITNGQVVYISGSTGIYPEVELARSDALATSKVLGIATQELLSPSFGYITTQGYVRGIKTDYTGTGIWGTTWVEGDILYVSKTDAGILTNIEPAVPHYSDVVGRVGVVHPTGGSILLEITHHRRLEELADVNGTALTATGQIPVWDNTAGYFDFTSNVNNYLPLAGGIMTGNIALNGNYLSGDGDNEGVFVDNTGNVGIGTTNPYEALEVAGTVAIGNITDGIKLRLVGTVGQILGLSTTSGSYNDLDIRSQAGTQLYIKSDGNVGIGTTSPTEKLEVAGQIKVSSVTPWVILNDTTTGNLNYLEGTDSSLNFWADLNNAVADSKINFKIDGSDKVTIQSNGNVGIGTTSPTAVLHLKASTAAANTGALKFTAGVLATTPEAGLIEFDGTDWYLTV